MILDKYRKKIFDQEQLLEINVLSTVEGKNQESGIKTYQLPGISRRESARTERMWSMEGNDLSSSCKEIGGGYPKYSTFGTCHKNAYMA